MPVTTYPERVLVVLNADGTLRAAHVERIRRIEEDGEVLAVQQLPAEPLDASTLSSVMPDTAALLAQVATLQSALAAVTDERDEALMRAAALQSALEKATRAG